MELKQKPSTLVCYICGREFGTRSLPIHIRACQTKFQQQQAAKEKKDRRVLPAEPNFLREVLSGNLQNLAAYNQQALQIHKYQVLPACKFCGRTFNEDSLKVHINVCPKKVHVEQAPKSYEGEMKKPRTLVCCVCGREFGLLSLKIHYPQCVEKFDNEEAKKPKEERRKAPKFTQRDVEMFETKTDWTVEEIEEFNSKASANFKDKAMVHCSTCGRSFMPDPYQKHLRNCKQNSKEVKETKPQPPQVQVKKPKVLVCFICGRQFGLASLKIHQKICKEKFINNEKLKQKSERRPVPALPQEIQSKFPLDEAQSWKIQTIEEFNQICNEIYRNQAMIQCSLCKRKFIQEAYDKHLRNCEKNHEKSASQPKAEENFIKSKATEPKKEIIEPKKEVITEPIVQNVEKQNPLKIKQKEPAKKPDPMKQIKVQNVIPETAQELQQTVVFQPIKEPNPITPPQIDTSKSSIQNIPQNPSKEEIKPQVNKSPRKKQEIIKNDSVLSQSLELHPCEKCGRKFLSERLQKHQAICKSSKNTLEPRNKPKPKVKEEPEQKQSDFLQKKEDLPQPHSKLAPCSKCGRKFLQNRLSKHQQCCKGKSASTMQEKKQQTVGRLKQNERIKNTLADQRIKQPQISHIVKPTQPINPTSKMDNENYESIALKPCSKCDRKFAIERLQVHENICKGKPKAKVDPPQKGKAMQIIKKTKQNFYKMVQDIKGKKIKDEEVDKQLEDQLKTISAEPVKSMRKQIIAKDRNQVNSKEIDPASVGKWNKGNAKRSIDKQIKRQKVESYLPKI